MRRQRTYLLAGGALAALGAHCLVAIALSSHSTRNAEPVVYAAATDFWSSVEGVLRSNPPLHRANSGRIDSRPGKRQQVIEQNAAILLKLKGASMPRIQGLKRVRVFPIIPGLPDASLLGFLARDDAKTWTVFTRRWRFERVPRAKHARVEMVDLNDEIDAALSLAKAIESSTHQHQLARIEVPAVLQDTYQKSLYRLLLFDTAYFAFASGRKEAVGPLLRAALYQNAEFLTVVYDELAWRRFEEAVLDLNGGAPRSLLSNRFGRIADEFPDGKYEEQAGEYSDKLAAMAAEDAASQPVKAIGDLTPQERVRALVFQLRDSSAVQPEQPGECWIPSSCQPAKDADANAADKLIAEGFDAVPALIEALADTRLTRSYGVDRNFIPWRYVSNSR